MVELAFSTNAYTQYPLSEAIERIASHGYHGVELLADEPHAYLPRFSAEDEQGVRETLAETELAVSNINANTAMGYYDDPPPSAFFDPSLITADDADRQWRIDYTKEAINLAAEVDAESVCIATGRPLPGNPPSEAREYLHESIIEILEYAERHDIAVGIEYEPELLIECTDEVLAFIDEIGRDLLGVNLDVGHAAVYGEDLTDTIHRCDGHITGVHLEDIAGGRNGKHYHLIPGDGDLDFRTIFDALDDIEYRGYATVELYTYPDTPDDAARRAFEKLEEYC